MGTLDSIESGHALEVGLDDGVRLERQANIARPGQDNVEIEVHDGRRGAVEEGTVGQLLAEKIELLGRVALDVRLRRVSKSNNYTD